MFEDYVAARLVEDPHVWATTLFDEVLQLGFDRSYPTFTRLLRTRRLRPVCTDCAPARQPVAGLIDHPPGDETQWDWLELPDPPAHWGWGSHALLLVGALAHSGRWRGVLAPSQDFAHLVDGLDRVTRALGGVTHAWRFDRMATVADPASGRVRAGFAGVAKHYGVAVRVCPPGRGQRKGVVEKANHVAAQRFWRTLPDDVTVEAAQARLDVWCATRGDTRLRATADGRAAVAVVADREPLRPVPADPFPAVVSETRVASAQALVSWRGNRYSVPPDLAGTAVTASVRLGSGHLDIATLPTGLAAGGAGAPVPTVVARHRLAADGAGVMVRDHHHVIALAHAAIAGAAAAMSAVPHRRKQRIPPGPDALAAARAIRATTGAALTGGPAPGGQEVVVDLAAYVAAAHGRNTLT